MASDLPKTMKAWQFTSLAPTVAEHLKLNHNVPLPDGAYNLQEDQILVRVLVAALNAVDYKFAEVPYLGSLIVGRCSTPGMDFAGRVAAVGTMTGKWNKSPLEVGQLVFGRLNGPSKFGTLAEYTIASRDGCMEIPEGVALMDAAATPSVALTAFKSIVPKIENEAGKRVFLNGGSGGCGTFGIQIAKAIGCHVTTTCSSPNVELCRKLGADVVIDYKKHDILQELKQMDLFDLVVDFVGEPSDLYWHAPEFTKKNAPYVQVGAGDVTFGFFFSTLFKQRWPALLGGGKRSWEFMHTDNNAEQLSTIAQWLETGKIKATVDEVFEAEGDGPVKAYMKVKSSRARGKVLVKLWPETPSDAASCN